MPKPWANMSYMVCPWDIANNLHQQFNSKTLCLPKREQCRYTAVAYPCKMLLQTVTHMQCTAARLFPVVCQETICCPKTAYKSCPTWCARSWNMSALWVYESTSKTLSLPKQVQYLYTAVGTSVENALATLIRTHMPDYLWWTVKWQSLSFKTDWSCCVGYASSHSNICSQM